MGQISWIARSMQQAGSLVVEQLRKRAMRRRDDRHPRSQCFDDWNSFRLRKKGRHREDVDRFEQTEFARPVHLSKPAKSVGHTEILGQRQAPPEIPLFCIDLGTSGQHLHVAFADDQRQTSYELLEPLFRTGPREGSHHQSATAGMPPGDQIGSRVGKALPVEAMGNDRDGFDRYIKVVSHERGEAVVERHELIDVGGAFPQELPNAAIVRGGDLLDEDVLTRKAADDSGTGGLFHPPCQAHEQRVGEVHHVGPHLGRQPCCKLLHLFSLVSLLAREC